MEVTYLWPFLDDGELSPQVLSDGLIFSYYVEVCMEDCMRDYIIRYFPQVRTPRRSAPWPPSPLASTTRGRQSETGPRGWPRSWANFSLSSCTPAGMHGPTCIFWASLTPFLFQESRSKCAGERRVLGRAEPQRHRPSPPGAFKLS